MNLYAVLTDDKKESHNGNLIKEKRAKGRQENNGGVVWSKQRD